MRRAALNLWHPQPATNFQHNPCPNEKTRKTSRQSRKSCLKKECQDISDVPNSTKELTKS